MDIDLISIEDDKQNGSVRRWFNVENTMYCITNKDGVKKLLDDEGFPIEDCNDHGGIRIILLKEMEKLSI